MSEFYAHNLGSVDISLIKKKALAIKGFEWDKDMEVQLKYQNSHFHTRMLRLFWPTDMQDPSSGIPTELWSEFMDSVQPLLSFLSNKYGEGKPCRIVLANLRAGQKIGEHVDGTPSLEFPHRVHFPLKTNKDVDFIINGKRIQMDVGQAYEINNQLPHHVENNGDSNRVHLIIDYYNGEIS